MTKNLENESKSSVILPPHTRIIVFTPSFPLHLFYWCFCSYIHRSHETGLLVH